MHKLKTLAGLAAVAGFGLFLGTGAVTQALAQQSGQTQQPQKKVKDQGEYDLYNSVVKETDPAKKLQYLNQWVEKYPTSDFQDEQLQFYNQLNQPAKVLDLGQKILAKNPKDLVSLTFIALNVQKLPNPTPDQMSLAKNSAQTILDNLDSLKPAGTSEAAWEKGKGDLQKLAKGTLMWVAAKPAMDAEQRKDYVAAADGYTKALQQYPDNAQFAYKLGSALISQKDPSKFAQAIYEIARAVATPADKGGLDDATRKQVDGYLDRIYAQYHGDSSGLDQLKQQALASPLPPADFKLETAAQLAAEKEEQFREKNPQLALWMGIKKQLTDANGQQYFDSQMKNAAVPKLKGTLVEAKPSCRPKELVVAISDSTHPEVTLKLDMPLKGKPMPGTTIQWEGVPSAFTPDPFMVTMDTETAKLDDVPVEACSVAPARRGARRGAKKK